MLFFCRRTACGSAGRRCWHYGFCAGDLRGTLWVQRPQARKGRIVLLLRRQHRDSWPTANGLIGKVVGLESVVDAQDLLPHPAAAFHGELEQLGDLLWFGLAVGVNDLH